MPGYSLCDCGCLWLRRASAALVPDQAQQFRREGMAYDGRSISRWRGGEAEQRAVFVDETSCIGCTHCTACAPNTFFMVGGMAACTSHISCRLCTALA